MGVYFDENGYDVKIAIGGMLLTTDLHAKEYGLTGSLNISSVVGQASEATFTFIPPEETVILELLQGQEVSILIRQGQQWEQVFFGYVDSPKMDFIGRKITLLCTDNRKNRVIKLPKSVIQTVGSYSEAVFGAAKDQSEELEKRLETVAGDFDFDRYGNYYLTPWQPKEVADFSFPATDISYNENPDLQYTNRDKTINTRNIKITYTYQRLHQQTKNFVWAGFGEFLSWYNGGRPTFPTKDSVKSAAMGSDWRLSDANTPVNFANLWPAGGYSGVVWQPNDVTEEKKGRTRLNGYLKDSTGNFVTVGVPARLVPDYKPVLDNDGNQIMDVIKTTIRDTSSHLCRAANFRAALRFSQTVTEEWNVQLRAPQAIAQNRVIDSFESYSLSDPYNTGNWEKADVITQVAFNFYYDQVTKRSEQSLALQVALNKARHDILDLHRDVTLGWRFKTLQPRLDLRNTIEVDINQFALGSTAQIVAKGRVYSINHFIDFKTTEAYTNCTLKLSRANGTANDDTWRVPTVIQDPGYIGEPTTITLGTWAGLDPETTADSDKWTGWICNKYVDRPGLTPARTEYPEKFVIDFPAIPDSLRDELTIYGDSLYNMFIPNDLLETSF